MGGVSAIVGWSEPWVESMLVGVGGVSCVDLVNAVRARSLLLLEQPHSPGSAGPVKGPAGHTDLGPTRRVEGSGPGPACRE